MVGTPSLQSIFLLPKQGCKTAETIMGKIGRSIRRLDKGIRLLTGSEIVSKLSIPRLEMLQPGEVPDLLISFGGDGTLLRAATMFPTRTPMMLPLSGGTLSFMLPLKPAECLPTIRQIQRGLSPPIMQRKRLAIMQRDETGKVIRTATALNEVNIHRGSLPQLVKLDCHVNGLLLTSASTDGLLVATPTGSTAYSLSTGGPLMHPTVEGILLTAICPRSLSFRPIVLPPHVEISVSVAECNRAPVSVSIDGAATFPLSIGSKLLVSSSPYDLLVICRKDATADWVHSINTLLAWNRNFGPR